MLPHLLLLLLMINEDDGDDDNDDDAGDDDDDDDDDDDHPALHSVDFALFIVSNSKNYKQDRLERLGPGSKGAYRCRQRS